MGNEFPLMSAAMRAELRKRMKDETDEMSAAEAKLRGAAKDADEDDEDVDEAKQSRAQMVKVAPDSRVYPLADQPDRSGPRVHEGSDALGREYSDAVMDRIAGAFSRKEGGDPDAVPNAGAGEAWESDTRDIAYRPQAFTEGDGTVGQEPRRKPFEPNMGKGPGSYVDDEVGMPTRVGDMRILNPLNSGIAPASGFRAPEPVRKSRKTGIFKNVVFGARGDQADSFLSE